MTASSELARWLSCSSKMLLMEAFRAFSRHLSFCASHSRPRTLNCFLEFLFFSLTTLTTLMISARMRCFSTGRYQLAMISSSVNSTRGRTGRTMTTSSKETRVRVRCELSMTNSTRCDSYASSIIGGSSIFLIGLGGLLDVEFRRGYLSTLMHIVVKCCEIGLCDEELLQFCGESQLQLFYEIGTRRMEGMMQSAVEQ